VRGGVIEELVVDFHAALQTRPRSPASPFLSLFYFRQGVGEDNLGRFVISGKAQGVRYGTLTYTFTKTYMDRGFSVPLDGHVIHTAFWTGPRPNDDNDDDDDSKAQRRGFASGGDEGADNSSSIGRRRRRRCDKDDKRGWWQLGGGFWGVWELVTGVPHFELDNSGGVFRMVPVSDEDDDKDDDDDGGGDDHYSIGNDWGSGDIPVPSIDSPTQEVTARGDTAVVAIGASDVTSANSTAAVHPAPTAHAGTQVGLSAGVTIFHGTRAEVSCVLEDLSEAEVQGQLEVRGLPTVLPGVAHRTAQARLLNSLLETALAEIALSALS
jgi:hypothetical protein